MPDRSVAGRRRKLLQDADTRALLDKHPELATVMNAYLWAYPNTPQQAKRRLLLVVSLIAGAGLLARRAARNRI